MTVLSPREFTRAVNLTPEAFTPIPRAFLEHTNALGLTSSQVMFVIQVMSYRWDRALPHPSQGMLAERMGINTRRVQKLERDLREGGFLLVEQRGPRASAYDFSLLFLKLEEVAGLARVSREHIASRHGVEERWPASFAVPFVRVPMAFLTCYRTLGISNPRALLLLELLSYMHAGAPAFPSQETLAERLGISPRGVRAGLKDLEEKGLLRTENRPFTSNRYHLDGLFLALEEHSKPPLQNKR